jgi:hypothetical protein
MTTISSAQIVNGIRICAEAYFYTNNRVNHLSISSPVSSECNWSGVSVGGDTDLEPRLIYSLGFCIAPGADGAGVANCEPKEGTPSNGDRMTDRERRGPRQRTLGQSKAKKVWRLQTSWQAPTKYLAYPELEVGAGK